MGNSSSNTSTYYSESYGRITPAITETRCSTPPRHVDADTNLSPPNSPFNVETFNFEPIRIDNLPEEVKQDDPKLDRRWSPEPDDTVRVLKSNKELDDEFEELARIVVEVTNQNEKNENEQK